MDQMIINALKLEPQPTYPFLYDFTTVETFHVTPETTVEEIAAKQREWKELGYSWEYTLEELSDEAKGEISDLRSVIPII